MLVRTGHARREAPDLEIDDAYAFGALDAGERVCAPHTTRGESNLLPSLLVALHLLGAGGAVLHFAPELPQQLRAKIAAVAASASSPPAAPLAPPAAPAPLPTLHAAPEPPVHAIETPTALPAPAASDIADAPGAGAPPAATAEVTMGALAPRPDAPAGAPLPPPAVNPSDPYQKRAVAVGLHPDVSRALLRRLSSADYRNAGVAIKAAIAGTPDDGIYVWPRQRKPELALFRIHFVRGAAPHCRRYVVTVTKDGWSTTAPPMENCDANLAGRRRS